MEYIVTASLTILFTVGFIFLYKYVINPSIVYKADVSKMSKCPDRWKYNSASKSCEPNYQTGCLSFDPDVETLNTFAAKCNLARQCDTTWSGFCA